MTIRQLTGKHNPLLKTIRLVSSGSPRAPQGLVSAEGVRVLEEVDRARCEIEAVLISEDFGSSERESKLLASWKSKRVSLYRTGSKLLESVSGVQTPQGALALVRVPEQSLAKSSFRGNALILCACGIQDPGNLGTLVRTAAAAGACLVCSIKGTVSARSPKSIRASAGFFFRVPVVEHVELPDFLSYCDRHSIILFRTDPQNGVPYTQADLRSPCAILLGNEGGGFADRELARFPAIRIPMVEGVESLNVSVAGAVIFFEALRQRRNL